MAGAMVTFLLVVVVVATVVGVVVSQRNDNDDNNKAQDRYAREADPSFWHNVAADELDRGLKKIYRHGQAKNVILFLGDGMGPTSVTAGRILAGQLKGQKGEEFELSFERFPHTGLSKTYNVDTQTTDSAASGTAYLTGVKTGQGMIGLSAKAKRGDCQSSKGAEVDSILKWFADQGRPTGLVTTTRVTHATPSNTYAHSPERNWEIDSDIPADQRACEDISLQLVARAKYINVIMGGGRVNFRPENYTDTMPVETGKRKDGRDLIKEWIDDKVKGMVTHAYVTDRDSMLKVADDTKHVMGLFSPSHMQYEVDRNKTLEPSLAEMTIKAIKILQKNTKGSDGFFLLVEGGRIDHGHHAGLAVKAIHEVVAFSEAVEAADRLTDINDTLIVVTADHSHVMSFSGYPARGNPIFGKVTMDKKILDQYVKDKMPFTTLVYGNGPGYQVPRQNLTNVDTADKTYLQQSAVPITEETHGGEDVAIYARGPHAHLYTGVHEQNYIPILMAYSSCVGPYAKGKKPCSATAITNSAG